MAEGKQALRETACTPILREKAFPPGCPYLLRHAPTGAVLPAESELNPGRPWGDRQGATATRFSPD